MSTIENFVEDIPDHIGFCVTYSKLIDGSIVPLVFSKLRTSLSISKLDFNNHVIRTQLNTIVKVMFD